MINKIDFAANNLYPIQSYFFSSKTQRTTGGNVSEDKDLGICWEKFIRNDKNNAMLNRGKPKFLPNWDENNGKLI